MKYRLYVDEVGNSDLASSNNPNHRYLSLTGVVVELDYVNTTLFPELENLKRHYFASHADDPVVLHRKELVNKRYPFEVLREPAVEQAFNADFLACLRRWQYRVVTVLIDKQLLNEQYKVWRYDPYHYCLKVLIERYVLWMESTAIQGDVMSESRGGREDTRLKESFARVYNEGSEYMTPEQIQRCLTSRQLKVKPKAGNIAGLQLADVIAHGSHKAALARRLNAPPPANFGGQIAQILHEAKYHRSPSGRVDGWGVKWLPQVLKKKTPCGVSRWHCHPPPEKLDWFEYTRRYQPMST